MEWMKNEQKTLKIWMVADMPFSHASSLATVYLKWLIDKWIIKLATYIVSSVGFILYSSAYKVFVTIAIMKYFRF